MKACFGARVFRVPARPPPPPEPRRLATLAERPSPEPVLAGRLTIERYTRHRTWQVPERLEGLAIAEKAGEE